MAIGSNLRMATMIGAAVTSFAAGLMGISARAGEKGEAAEQRVTVCIESGTTTEVFRAQLIAGKMFADIGVKIDWHAESACPVGRGAVIHIHLNTGLPPKDFSGALAVALPYEGVHIKVFADRLRNSIEPNKMPFLLAHVLAHEITHILQVSNRHSECGVMRAGWDHNDLQEMAWKSLPFTEMDVSLIRSGLKAWAARASQVPANSGRAASALK